MRRGWTSDEIEILREHYMEPGGVGIVAELTGRSFPSIYQRALVHHLHRGRRHLRGTEHPGAHLARALPLPIAELKTGKCPGKGNGVCGKNLWAEDVYAAEGYRVAGLYDLVCASGRRFPLPEKP